MNDTEPNGGFLRLPTADETVWTREIAAALDGQLHSRDAFAVRYYDDGSDGTIPMVRHPLVHEFVAAQVLLDGVPDDATDDHKKLLRAVDPYNRYANKAERIRKDAADGRFGRVVGMVERPYRPEALLLLWPLMVEQDGPEAAATEVAEWWDDTEFSGDNPVWDRLFSLFAEYKVARPVVGDDLLPDTDTFTVWRGVHVAPGETPDWESANRSWTLEKDTARWFADRFARHRGSAPWVMRATATHDAVWWVSDDRGEAEVVVEVGRLTDRHAEPA